MKYTSPEAKVIYFEAVSVILTSDSLPDTPELLSFSFGDDATTLRDFY